MRLIFPVPAPWLIRVIPAVIAFSMTGQAAEQERENGAVSPDKTGYNLFDPTPREFMREFSADRPDATESPYTVDAGHFQVEADFATFTRDCSNGRRTETWNIAPTNFKIGVLNNTDVEFIFDSYLHVRTKDNALRMAQTQSGAGDLTTRLKVNLWGNDGGRTAFALLPFIKFPTKTDRLGNDAVEGGLILPLAVELPAGFNLGLETAFSLLRDENNADHHAEFINSVTCSHVIVGKLEGYVEFFSNVSTEDNSNWVGTINVGLTYALVQNIQLDCGGNFGVTSAADDVELFTGITMRF